jgi:DNA-binding response OmpR family regulator
MANLLGKRILIVEDEFLIAEDLRRLIERAGATPIGPTLSERAARILASKEQIDAALLDVHLSDKTSENVALALKRRRVPFVIITGRAHESIPWTMRGTPFLGKPVMPDVVLAALETAIDGAAETAG